MKNFVKKLLAGTMMVVFFLPILPTPETEAAFTDVITDTKYKMAIEYLQTKGIVKGDTSGSNQGITTFRPYDTINRAEFLKIALLAEGENIPEIKNKQCFSDVPANAWFTPYVCYAKEKGYINGKKDGKFHPEEEIEFVEAAKILVEVLKIPTQKEETLETKEWYEKYVKTLDERNAIPKTVTRFYLPITRGEMAEMSWRILENKTGEEKTSWEDLKNVLIPEFFDEPEEVSLEEFLAELKVGKDKYSRYLEFDIQSRWKIFKRGFILLPNEEERRIIWSLDYKDVPIFNFSIGYIKDGIFFYINEESALPTFSQKSEYQFAFYTNEYRDRNISIGDRSISFQEKILSNCSFFSTIHPESKKIYDIKDFSVYQINTYYFFIKDKYGSCSLFTRHLPGYYKDRNGDYIIPVEEGGYRKYVATFSVCMEENYLELPNADIYKENQMLFPILEIRNNLFSPGKEYSPDAYSDYLLLRTIKNFYNNYFISSVKGKPDNEMYNFPDLWKDFWEKTQGEYPILFLKTKEGDYYRLIDSQYAQCY